MLNGIGFHGCCAALTGLASPVATARRPIRGGMQVADAEVRLTYTHCQNVCEKACGASKLRPESCRIPPDPVIFVVPGSQNGSFSHTFSGAVHRVKAGGTERSALSRVSHFGNVQDVEIYMPLSVHWPGRGQGMLPRVRRSDGAAGATPNPWFATTFSRTAPDGASYA